MNNTKHIYLPMSDIRSKLSNTIQQLYEFNSKTKTSG